MSFESNHFLHVKWCGRLCVAIALALSLCPAPGFGQEETQAAGPGTFREALDNMLGRHDRVLGAVADVDAARNRSREALAPWFPELTPTANYGFEDQQTELTANSSAAFHEVDLSLTQKLWDFGATNAAVEKARLQLSEKEVTLISTRQAMVMEAASAYANLQRAYMALQYAIQSEDNIRRQTGLEEARVSAGAGLSTDVLQAKTQLAGAEARRIGAQGALINAENRYRAVFGAVPEDPSALTVIKIGEDLLPANLDEALGFANDNNPDLELARVAEAVAKEDATNSRSSNFFPSIDATASRKWKNDVSGTMGFKGETLAKVELTLPFNLGFTAVNTLRAAQHDVVSKSRALGDKRRSVEEQVRNAWQQYNTARATAASLQNQAEIAGAFLELARQERMLGQRSLIDVLSGETSLTNALSDAASSETDVALATFTLMQVTGRLKPDIFREFPAPPLKKLPPMPEPAAPLAAPAAPVTAAPATPAPAPADPAAIAPPEPVAPEGAPPAPEVDPSTIDPLAN